jgi:hypothetical protein
LLGIEAVTTEFKQVLDFKMEEWGNLTNELKKGSVATPLTL